MSGALVPLSAGLADRLGRDALAAIAEDLDALGPVELLATAGAKAETAYRLLREMRAVPTLSEPSPASQAQEVVESAAIACLALARFLDLR